jgi:glycosyltransferase involved in cell wall biosynthesis
MLLTVLTPSYNRAHTLLPLFRSLWDQKVEFEWLVVDDGSTDETARLIAEFQEKSTFPLRYLRSAENRGKHVALNRGVEHSRGELLAIVDSDDVLLPGALDQLCAVWDGIPRVDRLRYAGVAGNTRAATGLVHIGFPPGVEHLDLTWRDIYFRWGMEAELLRLYPTELHRRHPFPEPPGQRFVTESLVWRAMGHELLTRVIRDISLAKGPVQGESLSVKPFGPMAAGRLPAYLADLNEDLEFWLRGRLRILKSAVQYARAGLHCRVPAVTQFRRLSTVRAKVLFLCALPAATLFYMADRK